MMIKRQSTVFIAVALICLLAGFAAGVYVGKSRGIPFMTMQGEWSIGIYTGDSSCNLTPPEDVRNPVLTAADVTDITADFVSDPFMLREGSVWYMFFEVWNTRTGQGDIGLATSSDGLRWVYKQIVLDEAFHISYPYVFKWKGEYYMIPESYQTGSVRLYRAVDFPLRWVFVKTLLYGSRVDPSVFRYNGMWWMFAGGDPVANDTLRLYYAPDLMGPWTEHPRSPVVEGDANIARPGGRVLVLDGRIIRYAQDDEPEYGNQVRAFEITRLTTESYEEVEMPESPVLKPGESRWNRDGMHTIDPHRIDGNRWIAAVDGKRDGLVFGFSH